MDGSEPNRRPQPLHMARGKNPWGDGPEPDDKPGQPAETPAEAEGDEARNPWLSPDEDEAPRRRRSASIEDIMRQGSGGPRMVPGGWAGLFLAGAVLAWLAATSFHMLERGERALVLTMGRYSGEIGPGANFTLPWPFQSVIRRKTGNDQVTLVPQQEGESLMPTRDGELIDVAFKVTWRITDLKAFSFNLPQGEDAIRRLADAQVRAAVAELPFSAIFGSDQRGQLQGRAALRTQKVLDGWRSGVSIVSIELTRVGPPPRLAETFKKIETAREDARRQRENDEAWRQQQLTIARREAAEFERVYAQYQLAPEVTRHKMYYETVERILRSNPVTFGGSGLPAPMPPSPADKPAEPK